MSPSPHGPLMALPGGQLQYYTVPESSDFAQVLARTFSVTAGPEGCSVPLLPDACMTLLFPSHGQALLCGPLTALYQLTLAPGQSVYGVHLRSGCGDWLYSESMTQLTGCTLALEPFLPGSDRLCAALTRCSSLAEQNTLFTRLATIHGGRNYQSIPLLRRCLSLVDQRRGQIRVAELASSIGCSPRYLNRLFHQKVGFAAKTYCELAQLHYSLQIILTTPSKSLLHLAVGCGYFDQAHMNRHYRQFLSCNANDIRRQGIFPSGREIPQPN